MGRVAVLGWRLGLGWLLGRRRVLLTTQDRTGSVRRSLVRYRFYAGNLYLPTDAAAWETDLGDVPRATAQAHPGPLGVRCRQPSTAEQRSLGGGRWIVLEPTGEPVPPGVEPDLTWVLVLAALAAVVAMAARLRRPITP